MPNSERAYIAVGFNGDSSRIIPLIQMNGAQAQTKVIRGVTGVSEVTLYCIDFTAQSTEKIGSIPWQDGALVSDVVVQYDAECRGGTVRIAATNQVWDYQALRQPARSTAVLDRDKVRQLEQEKQTRVLWPDELAAELQKTVFGQDEAIKRISEIIAANLRRRTPEVEVIVLFGPTGVGKTQTGKGLAAALEKLTGQTYGFQQLAMSQFISEHSLQQFFGSPPSYAGYKDPTVFEPCRSNPYQIFLLDEVEKSTDRVWTGLMECFSNSAVRLLDNTPEIDLSHAIFIMTSNVPIDMQAYNAASLFRKKEICRDALTRTCGRPEVAGKITNCLAFQPLPADAVTDIVLKFVVEELQDYGMELAHMDEALMVELKELLRSSEYGARSIKDAVRTALTFTVYDRDMARYSGKAVTLSGTAEHIQIQVAA